MIYSILKPLKTKNKILFETRSLDDLKKEVIRLGIVHFEKPYIFTHIKGIDTDNKNYLLTENEERFGIIVSPQQLEATYITN